MEVEYPSDLNKRFARLVINKWELNNHDLEEISCVYVMIAFDYHKKEYSIPYIGSTTQLRSRYKSHGAPKKIQDMGLINLLYYIPMDKGFYDYEIKLIRKLQPLFNKQHKK